MASSIEVKVPDIGDYDDVPVIELLVAVGDTVKKDQSLVTLESDKATMEVPSSADGVVKSLNVKVGDKVSEGAVIAILESADLESADSAHGAAAKPAAAAPAAETQPAPAAAAPVQA
ncbi:biotin/lipoyl-containing protein, partial [Lysobacter antibioticus]